MFDYINKTDILFSKLPKHQPYVVDIVRNHNETVAMVTEVSSTENSISTHEGTNTILRCPLGSLKRLCGRFMIDYGKSVTLENGQPF